MKEWMRSAVRIFNIDSDGMCMLRRAQRRTSREKRDETEYER